MTVYEVTLSLHQRKLFIQQKLVDHYIVQENIFLSAEYIGGYE